MKNKERVFQRFSFRAGLFLLLIILVVLIMSNGLVRWLTYPVPGIKVPSPPPAPFKEAVLTLPDGKRVTGWLYSSAESRLFLLFFHGNGENLATMWHSGIFVKMQQLGVNFLALDYPGYGKSEGKPSEETILRASRAAVSWITREFPGKMMVACGWSLGAAVAIQTAAQNPGAVHGLIALSAWTSLPAVASEHYPRWLVRLLLKEKYDSRRAIAQMDVPVLLIHGQEDRIIPARQGRELARCFPSPARWVEVPGAGHNDLLSHPLVWEKIREFLTFLPDKKESGFR